MVPKLGVTCTHQGEHTSTHQRIRREKNATDATTDDQSFRFSHFDVLQIPPDHHYIDTADEVLVASYRKTVHWVDELIYELKINMHVSYSFLICAA
jgi:hypothetical protein